MKKSKTTNVRKQVEALFSTAVALDQSGGLRNTVFVVDRSVYVMNYDHTVLIRFRLKEADPPFPHPVSFRANDYDSNQFFEEEGQVVFVSEKSGYKRQKSCKVPDHTPEDISRVYADYVGLLKDAETHTVHLPRGVLELLDDNLSHLEITGKAGEPITLTQRNIYSGAIIKVQQDPGALDAKPLPWDIEPLAMRTPDFQALFAFQSDLYFHFYPKGTEASVVMVRNQAKSLTPMRAFVSCCIYDEIINIKQSDYGRKEQKIRRRKQAPH